MRSVKFEPIKEPWAEYRLEDGTVVRIRTTLTGIIDHGINPDNGLPNFEAVLGMPASFVDHTDEAMRRAERFKASMPTEQSDKPRLVS